MTLADVFLAPGIDRRERCPRCSLEHASEHPIAPSDRGRRGCRSDPLAAGELQDREGLGVEGWSTAMRLS